MQLQCKLSQCRGLWVARLSFCPFVYPVASAGRSLMQRSWNWRRFNYRFMPIGSQKKKKTDREDGIDETMKVICGIFYTLLRAVCITFRPKTLFNFYFYSYNSCGLSKCEKLVPHMKTSFINDGESFLTTIKIETSFKKQLKKDAKGAATIYSAYPSSHF